MKKLLEKILYSMARTTLRRHRPIIVAVTGSIGKTTTKSAVSTVLRKKYRVRENIKSYNNEIGVPLTILGFESPGRSLFGWLSLFIVWFFQTILGRRFYPEVLVLEMGADKPGDIAYLSTLAPASIAVLTAIGQTHLEQFGSIEAVAAEKRILVKNVQPGGTVVLNIDDELVKETKIPPQGKLTTYGLSSDAMVRGSDVHWNFGSASRQGVSSPGTSFKVTYQGSSVPIHIRGGIGIPSVSAALGAIAVGLATNMHLVEISEALQSFTPLPGRLHLLAGISDSTIIDDTYNSSPRAVVAALEVLRSAPQATTARRIAVLGDMRELGSETEEAHEKIGEHVAASGIDMLLTVGESARIIARAARQHGFSVDQIFSFSVAEEAGDFLREHIQTGDVVLLKGSQNFIRLERTVKMIMAEPGQASELLVRQGSEWQNR